MIHVGLIIVARLDSSRLPGKVLKTIYGKPILEYLLIRLQQIQTFSPTIVIATSDREVDDPIIDFCKQKKVPYYRGDAANASLRILECAKEYDFDWFFRLNGDSPFVSPRLIEKAFSIADRNQYDFITNLYPRSYPYGIAVECLKTTMYENAYSCMDKPEHFEHITKYVYENIDDYSYFNIVYELGDYSHVHATIDTLDDFVFFQSFLEEHKEEWATLTIRDFIESISTRRRA